MSTLQSLADGQTRRDPSRSILLVLMTALFSPDSLPPARVFLRSNFLNMSDGQRGWAWGRKLILKEGGSSRRNSGARVLTETSNRSPVPVSLTHSLTRSLLHRKAESIKSAFLLEPFLSLHTRSPWMAISFFLFLGVGEVSCHHWFSSTRQRSSFSGQTKSNVLFTGFSLC